METIEFTAGDTRYPVHVGPVDPDTILHDLRSCGADRLYLLSDENVWAAQGEPFRDFGERLILPAGEGSKQPKVWSECVSWLAQHGASRNSVLLLLGGGVIGDLGGFVAATYMRGIRFANVATSLLAQIDACVGGKTGIDLPEGKNLVGSFHHPLAVWCDPGRLATLPKREYRNGMAEAIKYGLILDANFLCWQEDNIDALRSKDNEALTTLIKRCCELKAAVVAEDPHERIGLRSVLNFGHTVGHALEQVKNFKGLLHGEAVAVGMVAEAEIGTRLGVTPPAARERIERLAKAWELPIKLPEKGLVEKMMSALPRDKKASAGRVAMSLLDGIGSCRLIRDIDLEVVSGVLSEQ